MTPTINETLIEQAALQWLAELGYETAFGPEISPGGERPERESFRDVVLAGRLRAALARLNPHLPEEALEDALRQVLHLDSPNLAENNRRFHRMLRDGVKVEVVGPEGERRGDFARLFDFEDLENNDWLAVNQFTVVTGGYNRRADVVVFVNGLPLAVIELKNPADATATIKGAYQQLQTYMREIPELFYYNEILVVSDSTAARHGTITSSWERFAPWRTIEGEKDAPADLPQLEVLLRGIFEKQRFLDLVQNFVVFERDGDRLCKKMAMYHQYHAVNVALAATLRATRPEADRRVGVIWHTQGSGKSLSMVFYAAKLLRHPEMNNPTIVVLTDRNDLDQQIYENFLRAEELVPYPKQAESVEDLKRLLSAPAGGVVFTTVQKFQPEEGGSYPLLSERSNIVVIADEAHRSHYNFMSGYARYIREGLPNAAFVGFTGTPIELEDKSTRQVFGDYISVYDIQRAIADGATVPIYYEGRLVKLHLTNEFIDEDFEEVTEGEEEHVKEKLKSRWARLEALAGAPERLKLIARDILNHYTERSKTLAGKALIVCMSRRICVELYKYLRELPGCPEVAVVMTGTASDPADYQPHIRSKAKQEELKKRFRDPDDPLKLVIVREQLVSEAVASDEVVDIFGAAGLRKPDISILSDEFLAEVQGMEHKNLQVELLRRLIDDEIRVKMRRNVVRYRSFKEMLEQVLKAYQNRSLQSAEVIARLVELARELRAVEHRGQALGLTEEEMAFYDAVARGPEHIAGDEQLKTIARELVAAIKKNLSIDWTDHENVKAKIRATVKRLLQRYGYKPAECETLVVIIMEQAESLYRDWQEAA